MKPNASTAVKSTAQNSTVLVVKSGGKEPQDTTQTALSLEEKKQTPDTKKEEPKEPTLQELKDRATIVYLLQEKHNKLLEKRASLDRFAIKHDDDNARITVEDATGEEFHSSSPKTIAKLIEFWKEEFNDAINEVETNLKKVFNGEVA